MKRKVMKSFCSMFIMAFALLTSCVSSQSFLPIKGNGLSVDKDFNVSDFQSIRVSGGFDVTLVQGSTEGVTLSAQENLYEYIKVEVNQGVLNIYTEENVMATKPMKARIAFKSIASLKVSGGGDVVAENPVNVPELSVEISGGGDVTASINTKEMKCRMSGGGDARLSGSARNYDFDMSGGGDLQSSMDAHEFSCRLSGGGDLTLESKEEVAEAIIDINGGGDVEADLTVGKLSCTISGGGNASLSGKANELDISVSGGGDIHAAGFVTNIAQIQASGGSDIHVYVSKELMGHISGGGDVYYSGSPENITLDARGGSEIHRE
jgi:hypothetical protein